MVAPTGFEFPVQDQYIFRSADERQSYDISMLNNEIEIREILLGQRQQLQVRIGEVNSFVRSQL